MAGGVSALYRQPHFLVGLLKYEAASRLPLRTDALSSGGLLATQKAAVVTAIDGGNVAPLSMVYDAPPRTVLRCFFRPSPMRQS